MSGVLRLSRGLNNLFAKICSIRSLDVASAADDRCYAESHERIDVRWKMAFMACILILYIIIPGIFSYLSPGGMWGNTILELGFTGESDPGGNYIVSAHQIFDADGRNVFVGHPGITLQLLLGAIQKGLYKMYGSGQGSYAEFTARHLDVVYFISKLLMSVLTLISFYCVFVLSRVLGLSFIGAVFATAGYATSLPALFYLSRISVEPLMVIFFSTCIVSLCFGRALQDTCAGSYSARAMVFTFIGGGLSALGLYTKANALGPFPALCLAYLIGIGLKQRSPLRALFDSAAFIAGFLVIFFPLSIFIDWKYFFATWSSPSIMPATQSQQTIIKSVLEIAKRILAIFSHLADSYSKLQFRPQGTVQGIFNLLEGNFILFGIVGAVLYIRKHRITPEWMLLLGLTMWSLLIWWFRGTTTFQLAWHYLFIFVIFASVHFGYLCQVCMQYIPGSKSARTSFTLLIVVVLVFHAPSIWSYLDSRVQDVKRYNDFTKFFFNLQKELKNGEKVAALCSDGADLSRIGIYHGLDGSYSDNKPSTLLAAFPVGAVPLKNYKNAAALYEALKKENYSSFINFANGFSIEASRQPLEDLLNKKILLRKEGKLAIKAVKGDLGESERDGAKALFDDDPSTVWSSNTYATPFRFSFVIDLGTTCTVTGFKILPTGYLSLLPIDFDMLISSDGVSFKQCFTTAKFSETKYNWIVRKFAPQEARYIQIRFGTPKHFSADHYQVVIADMHFLGAAD